MLIFVNHLFENPFINFIALYPFNMYKLLNIMFTNTAVRLVGCARFHVPLDTF